MSVVTFKELSCRINGCNTHKKIGVAELNNPKALNALNLDMIRMLHTQMQSWESDENISVVFLQSSSDKSFCAGGDIVSLYNDIKNEGHNLAPLNDKKISQSLSSDFLKEEYALDFYLHKYSKPLIVWGNGFVIGGGLGLFAGCSHRIVTENTLMAMPEVAIGLYPEVGASWFLNKMPDNLGAFLAITGSFFNAGDAKYLGLSNLSIQHIYKEEVINTLCEVDWGDKASSYTNVDEVLNVFDSLSLASKQIPKSSIEENHLIINRLMALDNIDEISEAILNTQFQDVWLQNAQNKLQKASVLSVLIAYKQLKLTVRYSKAECFEAELNLSRRCCQHRELEEGIRAQLIDKDKRPQWTYKNFKDIEPTLISWFFSPISSSY